MKRVKLAMCGVLGTKGTWYWSDATDWDGTHKQFKQSCRVADYRYYVVYDRGHVDTDMDMQEIVSMQDRDWETTHSQFNSLHNV